MDEQPFSYAGFWKRLWADCIDSVIVVGIVFGTFIAAATHWSISPGDADPFFGFIILFEVLALSIVFSYVYNTVMQSSTLQATLGMMALKIITVDYAGQRISFARACSRELIYKVLWYCPFLFMQYPPPVEFCAGFMLAMLPIAITARKQGVHDMLSHCLVIKKIA